MLSAPKQTEAADTTAPPCGAQGERPRVSLIMVCRCEAEHIESVLASILKQEEPEGGMELVVADGMSEDGTKSILERIASLEPRLRIIDNPARFTSAGLNAAIRAARGQIVIRMDAHTHYAPDYIRQCVAALESTGADNVGGPWVAQSSGYLGEAIAAAFQSRFAVGGARGHRPNYEGPVDTVYLGCWRKTAFEKFGCFDESLVRNQDDEHNLRIVRGGGRIWQSPKIRCWYQSRTSITGLFNQYMQYGYWKVQVIRKHGTPASVRHLVPGAFLLSLLLLALVLDSALIALEVAGTHSIWTGLLTSARNISAVLLAGILSTYVMASVLASLQACSKAGWRFLPVLPLIFGCYHLGYGWGFLRGVLDFALLRRGASAMFTRITRRPPMEMAPAVEKTRPSPTGIPSR